MNQKMKKIVSRVMSGVMCLGVVSTTVTAITGCGGAKRDAITIMTEELSGLFNPFYATSGADMDVIGMTQIGMLSTNNKGELVAGDDEPTVVKAYDFETITENGETKTVYQFVLKNGLKFSDSHSLTMNDVMFNMYELLDPVYTGSSTMYSIDIEGLREYRTQESYSSDTEADNAADSMNKDAESKARNRIDVLSYLFDDTKDELDVTTLSDAKMREAIANYDFDYEQGYKEAVATKEKREELEGTDKENEYYRAILLSDYEYALKTFREELVADFKAAKESYDLTTMPYSEFKKELENDIFKFFLYEGVIQVEYEKLPNSSRPDKMNIKEFSNTDVVNKYKTEDAAIDYVFKMVTEESLSTVLSAWGTAGTLRTEYAAQAKDILLHEKADGGLVYSNISGIVSLGHTTEIAEVEVDGTTYKVAHDYNDDGTVTKDGEYAVLQITVNGTDPKAIYNFGFTVAPAHYYGMESADPSYKIDIKHNKFGVEWGSAEFQSKVIKSSRNVGVPVGAGAYKATNINNDDEPTAASFWRSNVVYYKANPYFMGGKEEFKVKTEKLRLQVIPASSAIDALEKGEIDYITPQFTKDNSDRLTSLAKKGIEQISSWSLGYGYIGINAGLVENINVRKAIMSAMQVSLASEYYAPGQCIPISWPMSKVSWAYPKAGTEVTAQDELNPYDYMQWTNDNDAKDKVKKYTQMAMSEGVTASDLKIRFTIAGASITEHPTYAVFKKAAALLNNLDLGWDIEVKADSQALTKLATGSLAVWAAAWGSTLDPDMYQVYHKDSTATSVLAWGYREIKAASTRDAEMKIITDLSKIIDSARETMVQNERKPLYKEALLKVCELAVEMPVYQRKTLYAYNKDRVTGFANSADVNPYSSPLDKIWELELVK